jgi:NADH:quinone reductase (non-electrogenic)
MTSSTQQRRRVVIVGAGFGGLSAAKRFANSPFDVTVVDRHNYHLFQPLLYQVATAGLSPADIASPIRGILRHQRNVEVLLAKVSGINLLSREVIGEGRRIPFDHLIIATGAEHAYFGHDWASYAPGLKTIDDATYLREADSAGVRACGVSQGCGGAAATAQFCGGRRRADWRGDSRRHR